MSENGNVLAAFTSEQAERLTNISLRQLRYWDKTEFFVPSLIFGEKREAYGRLYSFRDLVSLRVINALRNEANVSLTHLRDVKERLAHLGDHLWGETTLYVLNRKVIFQNPETEAREEVLTRQAVLEIPLRIVSGNVQDAIRVLRVRDEALVGKIERSKGVAEKGFVIAGTRISVRSVQAFASAGYSIEAILLEYPSLKEEDVKAAIAHSQAA